MKRKTNTLSARGIMALVLAVIMLFSSAPAFAKAGNPGGELGADQWFADDVIACIERGIMTRNEDKLFRPYAPMTRASLIQALANNSKTYKKVNTHQKFADVKSGHWFYDVVQWAAELGIVRGDDNALFHPNKPVTRAEAAELIYRYALCCTSDFEFSLGVYVLIYDDYESVPDWAWKGITWAYENNIMKGVGGKRFSPNSYLTRAQTAVILNKIKDMNDPSYTTYSYDINYAGKKLLTLQLPVSWKETAQIDLSPDTNRGMEIDYLARFLSKNNIDSAIGEDGKPFYFSGHVFSLAVVSMDVSPNALSGRDFQEIGRTVLAGEKRRIVAYFPSDVQGYLDMKEYSFMQHRIPDILESAVIYS